MVLFNAKEDIANKRKVVLQGKVVTIIDLAGRQARIAEDGKWYPHNMFYPLTEEHFLEATIAKVSDMTTGKKIAIVKPEGTSIQVIMEDNTRLLFSYSREEGLAINLQDSDGNKVV